MQLGQAGATGALLDEAVALGLDLFQTGLHIGDGGHHRGALSIHITVQGGVEIVPGPFGCAAALNGNFIVDNGVSCEVKVEIFPFSFFVFRLYSLSHLIPISGLVIGFEPFHHLFLGHLHAQGVKKDLALGGLREIEKAPGFEDCLQLLSGDAHLAQQVRLLGAVVAVQALAFVGAADDCYLKLRGSRLAFGAGNHHFVIQHQIDLAGFGVVVDDIAVHYAGKGKENRVLDCGLTCSGWPVKQHKQGDFIEREVAVRNEVPEFEFGKFHRSISDCGLKNRGAGSPLIKSRYF